MNLIGSEVPSRGMPFGVQSVLATKQRLYLSNEKSMLCPSVMIMVSFG